MNYLPFKYLCLLAAVSVVSLTYGQAEQLPPLDESKFTEPDPKTATPAPIATPAPVTSLPAHDSTSTAVSATPPTATKENPQAKSGLGTEPDLGPEPDLNASTDDGNAIKTAVIEGVQVSSEPGEKPGEKAVTCYFIFKDKPSSYFYEVKLKEKKIVFEFNDTRKSDAPINFSAELPMKDFTVEQKQINVNKEIKGLKAEYHNQVKVTFNVTSVPKIQVSDEFNVISFTYKWSNEPLKQKEYIVVDNGPKIIYWSAAGAGTIGLGVLAWVLYERSIPPPQLGIIPSDDLPAHKSQQ